MNAAADGNSDSRADNEPIDAFLLYNEREKRADWVADVLRKHGLRVHHFRSSIKVEDPFIDIERDALRRTAPMVVLLGKSGWSPNQLRLLNEANSLSKPLFPVLIGSPKPADLDAAEGLFRERLYVDLHRNDPAAVSRLVEAVRSAGGSQAGGRALRFDELIGTLVDGSDAQRSALLRRLIAEGLPEAAELGERLRERIGGDFAPDQQTKFESAVRDPSRLPSIRSWMLSALIWIDRDHPDSRELILRHLDEEYESNRDVRFWCLAGLIQSNAPYLEEATGRALRDHEPEVRDLAAVASRPDEPDLLQRLEADLHSPEFERAWHVLRILRVVPVPQLAPAVCSQLGRRAGAKLLTYDALFALANPAMAEAARDSLLNRPGLDGIARIILEEARNSNEVAVRSFASLLAVFDVEQARAAVAGAAENEESRRTARRLAGFLAEHRGEEEGRELFIAGYSSDTIDVGHDDIGITRDVETLAAVMLAREVTPPLAIGLFGPWGAGKSFFMKSIQAATQRMGRARRTHDSRFCDKVVHIEFNAWHYNDANLWASLVSHILDKLSEYVTPGTTAVQKEAILREELSQTQTEQSRAEADRAEAQVALTKAVSDLAALRAERERREIGWRDLDAADFAALLATDPSVQSDLKSALESVGAPAALASVDELDRVVQESYSMAGRTMALLVGLAKAPSRLLLIGGVAIIILAPLLIGWVAQQFLSADLSRVAAVLAGIAAVAGTATKLLGVAVSHVRVGLDRLSAAREKVEKLLAGKKHPPDADELALRELVANSRAKQDEAAARVAAAAAKAAELEHEVTLLRESQSLGYFLAQRNESDDYRRHLGLMSIIRKDFETLVQRLAAPSAESTGIDRIILYIDDLDRCPSNMVVDVLQAVHLLLAYELFVVVVSVDPRWLLRSLEDRYPHFELGKGAADEAWLTTPQDYLEKIFQIPFSVRPMGPRGFSRLMSRVLAPSPAAGDSEKRDANGLQTRREKEGGRAGKAVPPEPAPAPNAEHADSRPEQTAPMFEIVDEALVIRPWELDFASRLHAFVPTPRAAKRFANIYRILKAPLDRSQLARHEGTNELPGDFRLPMLLLALLVGRPAESVQLLPQFLRNAQADSEPFWAYREDATLSAEAEKVRTEVAALAEEPGFPRSPELVIEWLPRVARFSFATAGMRP
jgi:hypothetical protein